jgi:four helix bundle protein
MFHVLEYAHTVMDRVVPLEAKIRTRRKSLADEIGRAVESVAGNIAEGRMRVGLDRPDYYRRAFGSASELTTWLRAAKAYGYITHAEWAHVDEVLDRVRAMLWRLTH